MRRTSLPPPQQSWKRVDQALAALEKSREPADPAAGGAPARQERRGALVSLCEAYWYPLYAYVRRRGYSEDEARDLTQEFFVRLL